jgi:hypothetical protein
MASSPSAAARASTSARLVAFMAGQTRPVWDFEDIGDWWTRADADGIPRSSPCRRPRAPARRSAAPPSSPTPTHVKKIIFHPQDAAEGRYRRPGADRRPARNRSPSGPASTRSPTASRPIAPPATTRWPTASRSKAAPDLHIYPPRRRQRRPTSRRAPQHARVPRRWAPRPSRRASASSTRCRTRSAPL